MDSLGISRGMVLGNPEGVPVELSLSVLPTDVPKDRVQFKETWQANVFFSTVYLTERVPKCLDETAPVLLALDLECVKLKGQDYAITNIGYWCSSERIYHELCLPYASLNPKVQSAQRDGFILLQDDPEVLVPFDLTLFDSEKALIDFFVGEASRFGPDDYVGFNIQFDLRQVFQRGIELGCDVSRLSPLSDVHERKGFRGQKEIAISGCSVFDLYRASLVLLPPQEAYTLRHIASKYLNFEKKDYRRKIQMLRETDPSELVRYNLGDVYCCVALMDSKQLFDAFYERSVEAACNLEDTDPIWKWLEVLLFRRSRLKLPTKLESGYRADLQKQGKDLQGPRLLKTVPGVHENVVCIDFQGLYPAIAKAWNMSPETLNKNGDLKVGNGFAFFSEPKGVWPELIEYLLERKDFYDAKLKALHLSDEEKMKHPLYHRRTAYKTATVATTGLFAWEGFRLYVPEILDCVFFIAREIHDWLVAKVKLWGYESIYGDTDSIFVKLHSLSEAQPLCDRMNSELSEFASARGIDAKHFSVEADYSCSKIFFDTGAKRYTYFDAETGEHVVKGFEGKKVNVSDFSRDFQKGVLRRILGGATESSMRKDIAAAVHRVVTHSGGMDELAYYSTLRKEPGEYKKRTPALTALLFSNMFRGFNEFPLLDPADTHKLIPVTVLSLPKSLVERMKVAKLNPKKMKLLAYDLGESPEEFLSCVNHTCQVLVDCDKLLDLNIVRRVDHVFSALGWDFTGILPKKVKVGRKKRAVSVGQRTL
jgi:DNA polymerase elongation subunit (family B)